MSRTRRPRAASPRPPGSYGPADEAERQALMAELLARYARLRAAYEAHDRDGQAEAADETVPPVGHDVPGPGPSPDGPQGFQ